MNIVSSLLILFEVALLVLFVNNVQTSASHLYSTNDYSSQPENVGYFAKESLKRHGNVDHIARENSGDPNQRHLHFLRQPRNVDRILREVPSGPDPLHNNVPPTPANLFYHP